MCRALARAGKEVIIRKSSSDSERFAPQPEPEGMPVVMLASRLLWDKGVGEFVEAARRIQAIRRVWPKRISILGSGRRGGMVETAR